MGTIRFGALDNLKFLSAILIISMHVHNLEWKAFTHIRSLMVSLDMLFHSSLLSMVIFNRLY